eukprot:352298-Ditylum_brightwellii.AAC.1
MCDHKVKTIKFDQQDDGVTDNEVVAIADKHNSDTNFPSSDTDDDYDYPKSEVTDQSYYLHPPSPLIMNAMIRYHIINIMTGFDQL